MATLFIVVLILWISLDILTGSKKTFPLLLLCLCLIISTINFTLILMLPPENSITESSFEVNTVIPKKNTINKEYKHNMIRDKRFSQNHTKYLRLKAFAYA